MAGALVEEVEWGAAGRPAGLAAARPTGTGRSDGLAGRPITRTVGGAGPDGRPIPRAAGGDSDGLAGGTKELALS